MLDWKGGGFSIKRKAERRGARAWLQVTAGQTQMGVS